MAAHGISVFSVHPGIIPIGLSEHAVRSVAPAGSPEDKVFGWVRRQLAEGRGADPEWGAGLVVRLAAGEADALSGRHLSVHDDLDELIAAAGRIRDENLYTLRLGRLAQPPGGP